jgi:hypothetical protein
MNFNYTEHLGRFSHKLVTIFAIYLIIYLSFFYKIKSGIGQYWDWTTPYFKDQISNFFWNYSYSWNSKNLGEPLGYSTDYFLRYILSNFNFVSPEIWRYIFIVICFSLVHLYVADACNASDDVGHMPMLCSDLLLLCDKIELCVSALKFQFSSNIIKMEML